MSDKATLGRRAVFTRLGALALLVYVSPAVVRISEAKDGDSGGGGGGSGSSTSGSSTSGSGSSSKKVSDSAIRAAVKSGEAVPLADVLAVVRSKYKGQIVKINVSESSNRLVYNIRMIDKDNRLMEVRVSARSKRIISVKNL